MTITAPAPTANASAHPPVQWAASTRPSGAARPAAPAPLRRVPTWWRDASGAAMWALLLFVSALWVKGGGLQDVGTVAGFLTSFGRLTGLIASALLLVQVFLMARVPWFERAWGQDELARTHRLVGFTSFNLMLAHIVLITLGYAAASPQGVWGTIVDFTLNYPGMLLAIAGTLALIMVVVTSVKKARAKLRYESWHLIHLYGYLGAGLALPHQLWTGADFLSSRLATVFWWSAYAACLAAVLIWRVAVPFVRTRRSALHVVGVRAETPDVTTVTLRGRGLNRLGAQAGQFFNWRFQDGPGWTRANPYSLSAAPTDDTLRITVKHLGDGSARLAELAVGTKAVIEGPYGRLHPGTRTRTKVALLGAGIGITPMRALLEALPQGSDVSVIHRVSTRDDLVLGDELDALARERGARYVVVEGRRIPGRETWLPAQAAHLSDVEALRQLVPDIAERDVYICGAPAWMDAAKAAALGAGVPAAAIHIEYFTY
ncbi:MAG: ferredoxin reductase family protein [Dermatophilaceae bacterium]